MDNIDNQFEPRDNTKQLLPEIPTGFIRLTHFTDTSIAQSIIEEGKGFSYAKQGLLSSTTDSFSNNDQLLNLVKTGKIGPFQRGSFGSVVLIIDLDQEEHKNRNRLGYCTDKEIPNHNILGYIRREALGEIIFNPRYEPCKNSLNVTPPVRNQNNTLEDKPIVPNGDALDTDIW